MTRIVKTDGTDRGAERTETEGNQKTTGKQGRYGRPGGRDYTRLWPADPTDPFNVGRSISDGLRTYVGGHVLSWPPDSGIGLSSDGMTQGSIVGSKYILAVHLTTAPTEAKGCRSDDD